MFDGCIGRVDIVVVRPPAAAEHQPHTRYTVTTGAQFDARRRGNKGLKPSRDKKKTRTAMGRGEKSLLNDTGAELRLEREEDK